MMTFRSFILTGMAVAPVLWVYALVGVVEGDYIPAICVAGVGCLFPIAGHFLLRYLQNKASRLTVRLESAGATDQESLGILLLYLVPLLEVPTLQISWVVLIPAAGIFLAWVVTGHYHHLNPLLVLMGWHFYKVNTPEGISYLLLSRRTLRNVRKRIKVIEISTYTLMDRGETDSVDDDRGDKHR